MIRLRHKIENRPATDSSFIITPLLDIFRIDLQRFCRNKVCWSFLCYFAGLSVDLPVFLGHLRGCDAEPVVCAIVVHGLPQVQLTGGIGRAKLSVLLSNTGLTGCFMNHYIPTHKHKERTFISCRLAEVPPHSLIVSGEWSDMTDITWQL